MLSRAHLRRKFLDPAIFLGAEPGESGPSLIAT